MKRIIGLAFFSLLLYADVTYIIEEIIKIKKFKPIFKSIVYYNIFEDENISSNKNISLVKLKSTKENNDLKIYAIFQNKVNINGKWFKIGDIVNGYKIIKITNNYVYLEQNNKILKLSPTNYILKVKE